MKIEWRMFVGGCASDLICCVVIHDTYVVSIVQICKCIHSPTLIFAAALVWALFSLFFDCHFSISHRHYHCYLAPHACL